jgi:hypothetical protein
VAVDVKPITVPAAKPPDVSRPDIAVEAPVFPGMIEMIVGVVRTGVVPNPLIRFGVHVRGIRMVRSIPERAPLILLRTRTAIGLGRRTHVFTAIMLSTSGGRCRLRRTLDGSRPMRGNMSIANPGFTATLL